jgi:Fe2+ transport system protein B
VAFADRARRRTTLSDRIDRFLLNPWTGFPILAVVIYLGLYQFVGVFGGGGVSEAVSCGAAGVLSAQDGADECGGGA